MFNSLLYSLSLYRPTPIKLYGYTIYSVILIHEYLNEFVKQQTIIDAVYRFNLAYSLT